MFSRWASLIHCLLIGVTLREIELELLGEDHERERNSGDIRGAAEETMTEYLMLGLEIEGQQCVHPSFCLVSFFAHLHAGVSSALR